VVGWGLCACFIELEFKLTSEGCFLSNNGKHILIVDDEPTNAGLFEDFLTEQGFKVSVAGTAEEGLQKVSHLKPDLVLLDLYLPDMSGTDVCSRLRSLPATAHLPIILITAKDITHDQKMQGFHSGVDDFLVKPFEMTELLARINALFRRSDLKPKPELLAEIQSVMPKTPGPASAPVEPFASPSQTDPVTAPAFDSDESNKTFEALDLEDEEEIKPEPIKPGEIVSRIWNLLWNPRSVFEKLNSHHDFFISVLLILIIPAVASVSQLTTAAPSFDAWLSHLSFGLAANAFVWIGVAGALNLILPFHGTEISTKEAFIISGLATAPRLIGASLAAVYPLFFGGGFGLVDGSFSAGMDLIPGLPTFGIVASLGRIGVFDLWSAWIVLVGMWTLAKMNEKKWNILTLMVGFVCLIFGAFSSY